MHAERGMRNAESFGPPLRPDEDPAFWRRLMRGFALVCRGAAGVFPSEAARAKANALFCRDHALRLEQGESAKRREGEPAKRPHEARGSAASNACFGAY